MVAQRWPWQWRWSRWERWRWPARRAPLAGLRVSPNAFSAASSGGSVAGNGKLKTGATVSYTDSQAATTTFTVLQKQPGRRSNQGVCVKVGRKPHGKPCTRTVTIGSFNHIDSAGADSFHFSARVNGRKLKPGGYQLQAVARNAAGLRSRPVTSGFRVESSPAERGLAGLYGLRMPGAPETARRPSAFR